MNGFTEVCFSIFIGCLTTAFVALIAVFVYAAISVIKKSIRKNNDKEN